MIATVVSSGIFELGVLWKVRYGELYILAVVGMKNMSFARF